MVQVLIGEKGSGKTKALLENVHKAVEQDHGSVVFINNNKRHVFDLNYKIRMIDTSEFSICSYEELYGTLCGIISQNYDTTHIFLDSITKIGGSDTGEIETFLSKAKSLCEKFNVELLITISMNANDASDGIKKYIA